jgi:hypothetical protein
MQPLALHNAGWEINVSKWFPEKHNHLGSDSMLLPDRRYVPTDLQVEFSAAPARRMRFARTN